jgi:hypothetical protein
MESYCAAGECERPTREGRTYCDAHEKRHQRGQSLSAPLAERLTPKERVLEAGRRWLESDAEDDAEYERNERAFLRAARQLAPQCHAELVRAGLVAARARGVRLGRPPKVAPEQARTMLERLGQVRLAALALGVSEPALRRALGRTKTSLSFVASAGRATASSPAGVAEECMANVLPLRAAASAR